MTATVTVALTIYAFQTKYDFTAQGGLLSSFLTILIVFGLFNIIFGASQLTQTVYAAFGALLFSAYLVYDTQLLVGGEHKQYQLSPDDYVFAAVVIYLDIINLFLYLLEFLRMMQGGNN